MNALRTRRSDGRPIAIRLQDAVVVALTILLLVSIGVSSALWYRSSHRVAEEGARRVQGELASRIEDRILQFLAVPQVIIETNASVLAGLGFDPIDPQMLERLFLEQVRVFDSVSSVYAGSPGGGIVDAGREGPGGSFYVIETDGFRSGEFRKYSIDDEGHRLDLLQTVPDFDARTRPWYQSAVERGGPTWSDIYVLFSGQDMAVAASRPLYDSEGNLQLVLSSDIFLSQIDVLMRSMAYGQTGFGLIIDRDGYIVASSQEHVDFVRDENTGEFRRVLAEGSAMSAIRQTARFLETSLEGGLPSLSEDYLGTISIDGKRQFVQASPLRDAYGIDWISVVVIPEADFVGPIEAGTRTTLLFLAIALILTIGAGALVVRQVTRPLAELTKATREWEGGGIVSIPHSKRLREIRDLSQSFEAMSERLSAGLTALQSEIAEREQAQRTLQESEERLRTYIEQAPIAIFVANAAGKYTDVNPAACRMTGYSRDELLRIGIRDLIGGSEPEEPEMFQKLRKEGLSSGVVRVHKKDGTELWQQIDSVALEPNRLIAFCTDITQRLRTEESLRRHQKMESLGTMARGVAHEINNPLTGMMNYAELIESRMPDPQAQKYAANILREGERIAHIIRNLLSFARDDVRVRHPDDVRDIVTESLPLVHNALLRSHITVEQEFDEDVPDVLCSRPQIQQVIVNLLMNSRDALDIRYPEYDPNKIIGIRVTSVEHDETRWVRTSIHDYGKGMPPDQVERAFDPFFTSRAQHERTGLGLTISFGIIQEHGGTIHIESEEGQGTTVLFDLPSATGPDSVQSPDSDAPDGPVL